MAQFLENQVDIWSLNATRRLRTGIGKGLRIEVRGLPYRHTGTVRVQRSVPLSRTPRRSFPKYTSNVPAWLGKRPMHSHASVPRVGGAGRPYRNRHESLLLSGGSQSGKQVYDCFAEHGRYVFYSCRSATIGSIREARQAGSHPVYNRKRDQNESGAQKQRRHCSRCC